MFTKSKRIENHCKRGILGYLRDVHYMSDCCSIRNQVSANSNAEICPVCKLKGKKIKIITVKSMVKPRMLDTLNASLTHYFCSSRNCKVVYFDEDQKVYDMSNVKFPVHQKDNSLTVPICYCFGWTKEKIKDHIKQGLTSKPVAHIRENIRKNRCGCEVNNPQGSCCLANVTGYINQIAHLR